MWRLDKTKYMGGIRSTYLKITSDDFLSALNWLEQTIPDSVRSEFVHKCANNGGVDGYANAVMWIENNEILVCGNCDDCKYICDATTKGIPYQHIMREEKLKRLME